MASLAVVADGFVRPIEQLLSLDLVECREKLHGRGEGVVGRVLGGLLEERKGAPWNTARVAPTRRSASQKTRDSARSTSGRVAARPDSSYGTESMEKQDDAVIKDVLERLEKEPIASRA